MFYHLKLVLCEYCKHVIVKLKTVDTLISLFYIFKVREKKLITKEAAWLVHWSGN